MAYAPMFEIWRRMDDTVPIDIALDLGHGEDYPRPDLPWFFGVRIPMADQDEHGQPQGDELARLNLVENRIRELMRDRDAVYVGRATGGGNRDLVFYLPRRPSGVEDRIKASCGMEILFISRLDERWQGYEALLPEAEEWRQIEDLKSIQAVLDLGTNAEHTHDVLHRVSTTSAKGAEALAKLMEKLGLESITTTGTAPKLVVSGVQKAKLKLKGIHKVSWILDSKAPKAKGEYLGWTAEPQLFEEGEAPPEDRDAALELKAILEGLSTGTLE